MSLVSFLQSENTNAYLFLGKNSPYMLNKIPKFWTKSWKNAISTTILGKKSAYMLLLDSTSLLEIRNLLVYMVIQ